MWTALWPARRGAEGRTSRLIYLTFVVMRVTRGRVSIGAHEPGTCGHKAGVMRGIQGRRQRCVPPRRPRPRRLGAPRVRPGTAPGSVPRGDCPGRDHVGRHAGAALRAVPVARRAGHRWIPHPADAFARTRADAFLRTRGRFLRRFLLHGRLRYPVLADLALRRREVAERDDLALELVLQLWMRRLDLGEHIL